MIRHPHKISVVYANVCDCHSILADIVSIQSVKYRCFEGRHLRQQSATKHLYFGDLEKAERKGNTIMALREIRLQGDPVLEKECRPVKEITPRLKELIDDMFETMYEANGVGLAAPQVGVLRRICIVDIGAEDGEAFVLINPEILESDGEQTGDEGCLSLPGKAAQVTRPNHVKVRAFDEEMKEYEVEAEGLLARAFCHEIDHLDGHMYTEIAEGPIHDIQYEEAEEAEDQSE